MLFEGLRILCVIIIKYEELVAQLVSSYLQGTISKCSSFSNANIMNCSTSLNTF